MGRRSRKASSDSLALLSAIHFYNSFELDHSFAAHKNSSPDTTHASPIAATLAATVQTFKMADKKQIEEDADKLYIAAASRSTEEGGRQSKIWYQEDLVSLAGVSNGKELMPLIQWLTNQNLLRTLKVDKRLGWNVRPRQAAGQISSLDRDEKLIYEVIEEAHTQGAWSKDIRRKTSITQSAVGKALTKMEKNMLIKSVKSVKAPAQKIFMLYHLVPSEEVTGNSFFDAGDLDESFRDELMNLIVFWVRAQSWGENKDGKKKSHKNNTDSPILLADDADTTNKKRKRTADIEDLGPPTKRRSLKFDPETDFTQLLYRAGTHNYPTAADVHNFLVNSDVIKGSKAATLTVPEIQGCIDVLIWDDKLEKVPNRDGIAWGYRTVRGVAFKPPGAMYGDYEEHVGTGLTQAPCGRCPVFELCHEDGPVNPQECTYFEQWLKA